MAPGEDFKFARVVELGTAVVADGRNLGEGSENVSFGERDRGGADSPGLARDGGTQLRKNAALNLDNFSLGVKDFSFVLFELGSGEALGVGQSLAALVVGGNQVQVGL